ncbi:uncharacterized [Tachysurus ichikawai]
MALPLRAACSEAGSAERRLQKLQSKCHQLKVDLPIYQVNFNHARALSRAAAAAIPLGDGVTAYRITPPFIKEPVTHYSPCSSWSH